MVSACRKCNAATNLPTPLPKTLGFSSVHVRVDAVPRVQPAGAVAGVHAHEELIVWQLAQELKLGVYDLIRSGPVTRDFDLCDQLRRSAAAAPRNIAEGYGRFLPGLIAQALRVANGELKETADALQDGCDRGYFTLEQVLPLVRLSRRASKAASRLIVYLERAKRNPRFRTFRA
jgi:four helix bundle protein